MEEKVIGILRNISELLVATLVEENEHWIKVKNPAFLGIGGQNNQININFIPVEMLSLQPSVNVRSLLADPTEELIYTFYKSTVLIPVLELAQNVKDNYLSLTKPPTTQGATAGADAAAVPSAEDNIVKLF